MMLKCLPILAMSVIATADTLHVPMEYPTISEAIEASSDGDFVLVSSGLYVETIDFFGKAITVEGSGQETCTINAGSTPGAVVTFVNGEGKGSVLRGFTITGGTGRVFTDPIFGPQPCGGGIHIVGSSPLIDQCTLAYNNAWGGAGMFVYAGEPGITDCLFSNNTAEGHGGGIYALFFAHPHLDNCSFIGNSASWGGGITCTVESDPTVFDCTFTENHTGNVGGGIFCRSSSSPMIVNCSFSDNLQTGNPLGSGGGICIYGSGNGGGPCYPIITGCTFTGNIVNGDGGGISAAYDSHPSISLCTFEGNIAGRSGGGLACVADPDHTLPSNAHVSDSSFIGNSADDHGGGIHCRNSDPTITYCLVEQNAAGIAGGGISFDSSIMAVLTDTAFCGNDPDATWGAHTDDGGNTFDDTCVACVEDVNGDGTVGVNDVLIVIAAWGPCKGCSADIDASGVVDVSDLLAVIAAWGDCP